MFTRATIYSRAVSRLSSVRKAAAKPIQDLLDQLEFLTVFGPFIEFTDMEAGKHPPSDGRPLVEGFVAAQGDRARGGRLLDWRLQHSAVQSLRV